MMIFKKFVFKLKVSWYDGKGVNIKVKLFRGEFLFYFLLIVWFYVYYVIFVCFYVLFVEFEFVYLIIVLILGNLGVNKNKFFVFM